MVYLKIICNILKKKFKQKGRPRSWGLIFFNISNPVSKLYFRKFLARPRSWGFIFFEISNPASTWGGLDYEDYGSSNNDINEREKNGLNLKKEEKADENGIQNGKLDINSLKVEDLKNELKKRNVNIPKNSKKKDLQELLMNLDK